MVYNLAAAPQLTEKPQDVQKTIDDTLVWECKANAKPKPSYRWLKNGEPLDHMEVRAHQLLLNLRLHLQQRRDRVIPGKSEAFWSVIFCSQNFPRNKLCMPLLTRGHMCWGLNLAFRHRACAVLREGVCVFCEDAKAMAMISTGECSITILSLSFFLSGKRLFIQKYISH